MRKYTMDYVHNHILTVKERMEVIQQNLKWISSDIKFIEKISKPKETAEN